LQEALDPGREMRDPRSEVEDPGSEVEDPGRESGEGDEAQERWVDRGGRRTIGIVPENPNFELVTVMTAPPVRREKRGETLEMEMVCSWLQWQ